MLALFPERVLDNSIHLAIWVGVLVSWGFTERLGWVFAGFVVPGYLAAIAIVHPMSFVATVVEGVLTWAMVWVFGSFAARTGLWTSVFGRERFLLFILFSVPVRLVVEALAAPQLAVLLRPLSDDPLWAGGQFFSIGVVLVPLLANAFWKVGLAMGMVQVGTTTALTWALLVGVVIPLTNYELNGFELSFESVALDFLHVPKTYLLLLTTAVVAAWNNVRFGWDFNGILVPSLLALIVLTPAKLGVTLAEIAVLVVLYRGLVALPFLARANLEGPRRLVTMYTLAFGLKAVVAIGVERLWPWVELGDQMGFGYLVTSLVAVKCFQKQRTLQTLVSVGTTTLQGFALGTVIALGLALTRISPRPAPLTPPSASGDAPGAAQQLLVSAARVRTGRLEEPDLLERTFARAAAALLDDPLRPARAVAAWQRAGGAWSPLAHPEGCSGLWWPREGVAPPRGLPTLVACGGEGPALLVPSPRADPDTVLAAARMVRAGRFSAVLVAGFEPATRRGRALYLDALRGLLGERPVLWLASSEQPRYEPRTRRSSTVPQPILALLPEVALAFDGSAGRREAWAAMAAEDAVVGVPHELADPAWVGAHPTGATAAEEAAAWGVLLADLVRDGVHAGSELHARLLGADLKVDGGRWRLDGTPYGTWEGGGVGPWVVVAPEAAEVPGLGGFSSALAGRLDARVLWSAAGVSAQPELQPADLPLLEALRAAGAGASLLVVRAQPPALAPREDVVWSSAHERPLGGGPPDALGWEEVVAALDGYSHGRSAGALYDRDLWAVRYQAQLSPARLAVLHVAPRRLSEVDDHPDKAGLLAWARWSGVAVLDEAPATGPLAPGGADAELLARLGQAWTDGALHAVRDAGLRPVLVDHGARLEWWGLQAGTACSPSGCARVE